MQKKTYEPQLKEIEDKLSDYNKILKDKQKATDDIMNLKFELSDMERKANAGNQKKRMEIQLELDGYNVSIRKTGSMIRTGKTSIKTSEREIEDCARDLEKVRADWKKAKELAFDESSINCPMCGQKLPEDKIESMRAEFDERKAKNLKNLKIKAICYQVLARSLNRLLRIRKRDSRP